MAIQEMKQGYVMNIQRYSLHDGPGIRTVVFLKGCPLRCKWCSNPESWNMHPEISFDEKKCLGSEQCSRCIRECANDSIRLAGEKIAVDWEKCINCIKCADACPTGAINKYGDLMTVDQVIKIIEKESVFYSRSKGGLTISGGEATLQIGFTRALLRGAKKRRINTALETCGYAQWDNIAAIKDSLDLIYYDIKSLNDEKHLKFTGVSNELILDNLKKLRDSYDESRIIVRTPVIPGFNDTREDILAISKFLRKLGISRYELLRYHRFGSVKYQQLGREYEIGEAELSIQRFEELEKIAKNIFENGGQNNENKKVPITVIGSFNNNISRGIGRMQ